MELEYTQLKDHYDNRIYVGSLLWNGVSHYVVKRDTHLEFSLFDLFNRTHEKLTHDVARNLIVIPDETEVRFNQV